MTTGSKGPTRALPERPNVRHLKDQAKDLFKSGAAESLADAQFQIARLYGFASWPKLRAHVDSLNEIGELKLAIDTNDLDQIKTLMTSNPSLHRAPLGYGKDGPLTWVAECRVPWEPPSPARLAIARWMIENGSDVHQGGDGPLMRAALRADRIPMMGLLVSHGADVNAVWHDFYPIIFAPSETVGPVVLKWLLDHGADPNCVKANRVSPKIGTALDYVICSYERSLRLSECIDILLEAGGVTKYNVPAALALLRGRLDHLANHLDREPDLVHRRFPELDFGETGERRLRLTGATLLHVAAEYGNVEATKLLLDRGADVNAQALTDAAGIGGQTPIFHAVTQGGDWGLAATELLMDRGADLSVRAKLPGYYERPDEIVDCTPLGYALRFPENETDRATVAALRRRGAVE